MSIKHFFTSYFDSLSDKETRYHMNEDLDNDIIEDFYFNFYEGKDSFSAVVLQVNDVSPGNNSQQSGDGEYFITKVRPIDIHDFIIPNPCEPGLSVGARSERIDLHPTAFSNFKGVQNQVKVGDVVRCYFEQQGPQFHGKQRGLRFYEEIVEEAVGKYDYDCLGKFQENSSKQSFDAPRSTKNYVPQQPTYDPNRTGAENALGIGTSTIIDGNIADKDLNCKLWPFTIEGNTYKDGWCRTGKYVGRGTNFHVIKSGKGGPNGKQTVRNYRSAQPGHGINYWKYMKKAYGIKYVITTNHEPLRVSKKDRKAGEEKSQYVRNIEQVLGVNSVLQAGCGSKAPRIWKKVFEWLSRGDCLIHCSHGADRTGACIARWQIDTLNWSQELAYANSRKHGFKSRKHPGYGKGPDPNRSLRYFIETGRREPGANWDGKLGRGDKQD